MEKWTGLKLGKEYVKAIYCHSAILIFYAEYIMQNARLDDSQAEIKIAWRHINLRYADDTTLKSERQEELKRRVKKLA